LKRIDAITIITKEAKSQDALVVSNLSPTSVGDAVTIKVSIISQVRPAAEQRHLGA